MGKKHYEALGVSENASVEDIKKAFKKMAVTHHPDKGGEEKRFKEINEANNILSDPQKRRLYDIQGDSGEGGNGMGGGGQGNPFQSDHGFPFSDFGFMNVFFNNHMQQGFGGGGGGGRQKGPTVYNKTITVSLEEAYRGSRKEVDLECHKDCVDCMETCNVCRGRGALDETVRRMVGGATLVQTMRKMCSSCGGQGIKKKSSLNNATGNNCKKCKGTGRQTKTSTVQLDIPSGVPDNYSAKMKHPLDGDSVLVIKIEVRNTIPGYVRRGDDLEYTLKVSLLDALLGKRFEIPHPSGNNIVLDYTDKTDTIAPNSSRTIQGKGMTESSKLIVKFEVEFPRNRRESMCHDPGKTSSPSPFKKMREIYGELFDTA